MNQPTNSEGNKAQGLIEDLPVAQGRAAEVKGGPIYMNYEGIEGDVTAAGHEKWIELSGGPRPGGNQLGTSK